MGKNPRQRARQKAANEQQVSSAASQEQVLHAIEEAEGRAVAAANCGDMQDLQKHIDDIKKIMNDPNQKIAMCKGMYKQHHGTTLSTEQAVKMLRARGLLEGEPPAKQEIPQVLQTASQQTQHSDHQVADRGHCRQTPQPRKGDNVRSAEDCWSMAKEKATKEMAVEFPKGKSAKENWIITLYNRELETKTKRIYARMTAREKKKKK